MDELATRVVVRQFLTSCRLLSFSNKFSPPVCTDCDKICIFASVREVTWNLSVGSWQLGKWNSKHVLVNEYVASPQGPRSYPRSTLYNQPFTSLLPSLLTLTLFSPTRFHPQRTPHFVDYSFSNSDRRTGDRSFYYSVYTNLWQSMVSSVVSAYVLSFACICNIDNRCIRLAET